MEKSKNIRDLETFLAVAQMKSLSKATRKVSMSAQGISKVIINLEQEMDAQLFVRTPQGMILTESGEAFLEYAKSVVSEYEDMSKTVREIENRHKSVLNLVSAFGIIRLVTPECITSFKKRYPEIVFNYREDKDLFVDEAFLKREANVALALGTIDEKIREIADIETIASKRIMLLVYKGHPLSQRDFVSIEDLRDQPLYIEGKEFKIYHQIVDACKEKGFVPNIIFETSGLSLCHKMVRDKKGIAVTVDFFVDDMPGDEFVVLPFDDESLQWTISMLIRKADKGNPAIDLWKKHFSTWLQEVLIGVIDRK